MLVDDDPALLHALSFAFETEGYLVYGFSDAEGLLADAGARHAAVCFVLSQRLPGLTGLGLLAALRAEGIRTPAILTTFNPKPGVGREARAAGVDIVEKPLLDGILASKVRAAVNAARLN